MNDLATDAEVTRRSARLRADARAEGGTLRATDLATSGPRPAERARPFNGFGP
ncbi:hypothetical protein ACWCO9_06910 [Streptomyces sp. NPDC001937]